jgi:hypothetical protein
MTVTATPEAQKLIDATDKVLAAKGLSEGAMRKLADRDRPRYDRIVAEILSEAGLR